MTSVLDSGPAAVRRRLHPVVRLLVGLAVGGAAVWFVVSRAGGVGDAVEAIGRMKGGFIAVAVAMAVMRLWLYSLQWWWLGRRSGRLGFGTACAFGLVVFGFGAVTPASPAEGLAIASRELVRRGRSKRQAHLSIGFSEWFAQRTFYGVAAVDLIIVVSIGHLTFGEFWPLVIVATVVLVALAGTAMLARRTASAEGLALILGAIRLRRPQPPVEVQRQAAAGWHGEAMEFIGPPANRVRLATVSAGAVLADAATLWATCHAAGFHIRPDIALLATTAGTMVSWVPLLPGGLGLVEAVVPAILHRFGAPLDGALGATLVYRAAGTVLPAVAGGAAIAALWSHRTTPVEATM